MAILTTRVLDVSPDGGRVAKDFPLLPVCHLSLSVLTASRHRLPAPRQEVWVLDGPDSSAAVEWIRGHGRKARLLPSECFSGVVPGELWEPGLAAREIATSYADGHSVLDLGCGSGRDAVFLSSVGFQVTAVDRLPKLLVEGARLERDVLRTPSIDWLTQAPAETFDNVLMAYAYRPELLQRGLAALKSGGMLFVEGHSKKHHRLFGSPASSFCLDADLLGAHGLILSYREEWRMDRHCVVATMINN